MYNVPIYYNTTNNESNIQIIRYTVMYGSFGYTVVTQYVIFFIFLFF